VQTRGSWDREGKYGRATLFNTVITIGPDGTQRFKDAIFLETFPAATSCFPTTTSGCAAAILW